MSLDLCLKQLHVVHIKVFHRMQYIRLLLFYSAIFQSVIFRSVIFQFCKFQLPDGTDCVTHKRAADCKTRRQSCLYVSL